MSQHIGFTSQHCSQCNGETSHRVVQEGSLVVKICIACDIKRKAREDEQDDN